MSEDAVTLKLLLETKKISRKQALTYLVTTTRNILRSNKVVILYIENGIDHYGQRHCVQTLLTELREQDKKDPIIVRYISNGRNKPAGYFSRFEYLEDEEGERMIAAVLEPAYAGADDIIDKDFKLRADLSFGFLKSHDGVYTVAVDFIDNKA